MEEEASCIALPQRQRCRNQQRPCTIITTTTTSHSRAHREEQQPQQQRQLPWVTSISSSNNSSRRHSMYCHRTINNTCHHMWRAPWQLQQQPLEQEELLHHKRAIRNSSRAGRQLWAAVYLQRCYANSQCNNSTNNNTISSNITNSISTSHHYHNNMHILIMITYCVCLAVLAPMALSAFRCAGNRRMRHVAVADAVAATPQRFQSQFLFQFKIVISEDSYTRKFCIEISFFIFCACNIAILFK